MKNYFVNCQTAEELKKEYHKLAMKMHPDNGGDENEFKQMQIEFSKLWNVLKNVHVTKDGKTYDTTGTDRATTETAEEFMDIINRLMFVDALHVEMCGSWIWVSGDTKSYREFLKELGFQYSANKQMWYYHKDQKRKFYKGKKAWTIDQEKEKLEATA